MMIELELNYSSSIEGTCTLGEYGSQDLVHDDKNHPSDRLTPPPLTQKWIFKTRPVRTLTIDLS